MPVGPQERFFHPARGSITPIRRELGAGFHDLFDLRRFQLWQRFSWLGFPCQQPANQHTEGEDIGPTVGLREAVLLGRREIHRSKAGCIFICRCIKLPRNSKIDQPCFFARINNDVLRLDVAMNDWRGLTMQVGEDIADLRGDCNGLLRRRMLLNNIHV
ncbi:hypothetical protein SDC9_172438 [bioreactor metagenome]|uniref:Uncharacterized protein n=1 Tax=bioreactor metagenome TaxID=1076179 RepID=A0A645GDN4_9ZZZZ